MPNTLDVSRTPISLNHPHIGARAARANLSKVIQAARFEGKIIIITDYGEPAVAFISIEQLQILDLLDRLAREKPKLYAKLVEQYAQIETPP